MNTTNFEPGDVIRINTHNHPDWHGKAATIQSVSKSGDSFTVAVPSDDGTKETLLNLSHSQIIKVMREPALTKLIDTIPGLTKDVGDDYNARQDAIVEQTNRDIKIFQAGRAEGYVNGFSEGYLQGYDEAFVKVNELKKHGLIPPGDNNDTN